MFSYIVLTRRSRIAQSFIASLLTNENTIYFKFKKFNLNRTLLVFQIWSLLIFKENQFITGISIGTR